MPKTRGRIIEGVLDLWMEGGCADLSVRTLARHVSVPPSAIHYHFGNIEQLFHQVQQVALDQAEQWCEDRLEEVPQCNGGTIPKAGGLAPLFTVMVERWCGEQRRLAFAWRECQLLGARDPAFIPLTRQWAVLWRHFWEALCKKCGWVDAGRLTACLFDGESLLHLISGDRLLDRLCLAEMADGWESWLAGQRASEGHWRSVARQEAAASVPQQIGHDADDPAHAMAQAAAAIVAEEGIARLTHRAVAAKAKLTLGVVSYRFRTSSDLLHAAFETIYRSIVPQDGMTAGAGGSAPAGQLGQDDNRILALWELMLAVARDPELGHLARQLRYLRGCSSQQLLTSLIGGEVSTLDGALYSNLASGQQRAAIGLDAEERRAAFGKTARHLSALLSPGVSSLQPAS